MSETRDDEKVLCVPADLVRILFGGRNWLPRGATPADLVFPLTPSAFVRRGDCENDPSLKQIIPYVVLRCGDQIYAYTRGAAGGEDRLHAKWSIGLGGHVNPSDEQPGGMARTIIRAANREFNEEVGLAGRNTVTSNRFAGLISDDSDAVGRVHLGVCLIYDLYAPSVSRREAAIGDGRWCTVGDLRADVDRLERWSQICVEHALTKEEVQL